jgi:hypothetical protein
MLKYVKSFEKRIYMKKIISIFLTAAISLCLFTACGQTETEITETETTVATEQNLTETTTSEATTVATEETTPEETELTTTVPPETEAGTETVTEVTTEVTTAVTTAPPRTEVTTTAPKTAPAVVPVTTADNSNDTRSTQQKLDDIIAANPNVEIGYALYNADTSKYLYHYNDELQIDVSGEVPIYWLYRLLDREGAETRVPVNFREETYENSYIFKLSEEGQMRFEIGDLINYYFYDQDAGAKAGLEMQVPLVYEKDISVNGNVMWITEKDGTEKSSITQYIAKWVAVNDFVMGSSGDSKFLKNLLRNSDRNSYFYKGTGVLTVHAGDKIGKDYYDTGLLTVNGVDYIYVIYTKNTNSSDIVEDISRYYYDDLT